MVGASQVQDVWHRIVCWVPVAKQLVWWALAVLLALTDELQGESREARLHMGKARDTGPLRGVQGVVWKGWNWRVGAFKPRIKCIFTEMLPETDILGALLPIEFKTLESPGVVKPCTNGDRVCGVVDPLLPLPARE